MFTRNPNDPAQITIRLANERVVLETPKLRLQLDKLIEAITKAKENLDDVREFSNDGKDYLALRAKIIAEFGELLKPATKESSSLKKRSKRASIYVREPLANIDSALYQMQGTITSLSQENLGPLRAHVLLIKNSLLGIHAGIEKTVATAVAERKRALWNTDLAFMATFVIIFAVACFGMGVVARDAVQPSHVDISQFLAGSVISLAMAGASIALVGCCVQHVVRYFRATKSNWSAIVDTECEATA